MENFTLPEFLLADFPIKNESFNDDRQFIVHKGFSLIEVIPHCLYDAQLIFDDKFSKQFSFFDEEYTLVFHTNNVDCFGNSPEKVLKQAFNWYREYLIWEDTRD